MNQQQEQLDGIVIVGGGPVGLALALTLARYHIRSLVLEKREAPTPRDQSRAITWMPRGLEFADWLGGLTPRLLQQGVLRTDHDFVGKSPLLRLSFQQAESPHPYTLNIPQHDTEMILEEQARATSLVEIRRGHTVMGLQQDAEQAMVEVESAERNYLVSAPWAIGCDGAQSQVRKWLGIEQTWQDYGAYSAVADVEMQCDLPETISQIVLDPARPYGFFYFAPGRWRLIYRINNDEDRHKMVEEQQALQLIKSYLPHATIQRFLWASSFRLGQGQCVTYYKGRWVLAGDAAHAMGPSAGAGMMVGLLGVWRLGWRLALLMHQSYPQESLLEDYTREQQGASNAVQTSNGLIFRNLALTSTSLAILRAGLLRILGSSKALSRLITDQETLEAQVLLVENASDIPETGAWETQKKLGAWRVGHRLPYLRLADYTTTLDLPKLKHLLIPIGIPHEDAEDALAQNIMERLSLPVERLQVPGEVSAIWRVRAGGRIAFALVRPDQHIVRIFSRRSSR